MPTIELPLGPADAPLPVSLIPYEEGKMREKPVQATYGFGPLPIFLAITPGPVTSPSRWLAEEEQTNLLRAMGWPCKFQVTITLAKRAPISDPHVFFQAKNIQGGLDKKDWAPYLLRQGPAEWPAYTPPPPRAGSSRTSTGEPTLCKRPPPAPPAPPMSTSMWDNVSIRKYPPSFGP